MTPPDILFHIGAPRTGSTSLQHSFHRHPDLLQSLGYRYGPDLVSPPYPEHTRLVWALFEQRFKYCDRFLARARQAAGSQTVLLSSEAFYTLWPRFSRHARQWVRSQDWTAVLVLRDQASFTRSLHQHCRASAPVPAVPELGTQLAYEDFCRLPHIQSLAGYNGMRQELDWAFKHRLIVAPYEDNMVNAFYAGVLGCKVEVPELRLNESKEETAERGVAFDFDFDFDFGL